MRDLLNSTSWLYSYRLVWWWWMANALPCHFSIVTMVVVVVEKGNVALGLFYPYGTWFSPLKPTQIKSKSQPYILHVTSTQIYAHRYIHNAILYLATSTGLYFRPLYKLLWTCTHHYHHHRHPSNYFLWDLHLRQCV